MDKHKPTGQNLGQVFNYRLGNWEIWAAQKILFMNETKQFEIWLRPKGWAQKIFFTLPPNIVKGFNDSWHKFCLIFCLKSPSFSYWPSKLRRYFNKILHFCKQFSRRRKNSTEFSMLFNRTAHFALL